MALFVRRIVPFVLALPAIVFAAACSKDSTSSSTGNMGGAPSWCELGPACRQISMACMPKDLGKGAVHDCHVAGMETGIESKCEEMLNTCITTCNAAPGFGDAGGFDVPVCEGGT